MPKIDRDPVQALKRCLRSGKAEASPTLADSIRAIKGRLSRARRVDRRISLSDALLAYLAGE
jgi:hypothetical protein